MYGKKRSLETRQKHSETAKARPHHLGGKTNFNFIGEKNVNAKLTMDIANEIRELYKTGQYSQQKIADIYSVGQNTVSSIIRNKTWKQ